MTTTLDVKLHFTPSPPPNGTHFYYSVSHTDSTGALYTAQDIQNGGTVAFIREGQYILQDSAGNPAIFTFDALAVSKDSALGDSLSCGDCDPYDLGAITFPVLGAQETVTDAYQWCQGLPTPMTQSMSPEARSLIVDPKLGVSNTKGTTEQAASGFGDCECGSCN